jgi:exonuclease III
MKIVTLNIRQGGGGRLEKLLSRLLSLNVDTLVLTEFRENKNAVIIKNSLTEAGYLWQATCENDSAINSILIASRAEFEKSSLVGLPESCRHRALLVRFSNFSLLAVYFAQGKEKQTLFDYISSSCIQELLPRGLVIGDFNTGRPYLDEANNTFACTEAFTNLEEIGLIDSWRSRNLECREFSWYSNKGNGFRIDHVFSTLLLNQSIQHVGYNHLPRINDETDHSAMIVEFDAVSH